MKNILSNTLSTASNNFAKVQNFGKVKTTAILLTILLSINTKAQTPVADYPFTGDANDQSINLTHGTVYGATLTTDRFGNESSAYSFNGIDDYIDMGDPVNGSLDFNHTSSFTLGAWVKTNIDTVAQTIIFKRRMSGGTHYEGYKIGIDTDGELICALEDANNTSQSFGGARVYLSDNIWHYVTVVRDGDSSTIQFYVDGVKDGGLINDTTNTSLENTQGFWIGKKLNYDNSFNGSIDDVHVYNTALDSVTIDSLFHLNAWTKPTLCGNYNIGVGQDYETISEALYFLTAYGVSCPVTFFLTDTAYNEPPTLIYEIPNVSAENRVTITPADGIDAVINITTTSSSNCYGYKMAGTKFLSFDGSWSNDTIGRHLSVFVKGYDNNEVFYFNGYCSNNIIRNCIIEANSYNAGNNAIYFNYSKEYNDSNLIHNNWISCAHYGIQFSSVYTNPGKNNIITNNLIGNTDTSKVIGRRGISCNYQDNLTIKGNEIFNIGVENGLPQKGIYSRGIDGCEISNNYIHNIISNTTILEPCRGIQITESSSNKITDNLLISNNIIKDIACAGNSSNKVTGIYINADFAENINILNNTIYLKQDSINGLNGGGSKNSSCLYISSNTKGLNINNNIFYNALGEEPNDSTLSEGYGIFAGNYVVFNSVDNNIYYTENHDYNYAVRNQSILYSLSEWQNIFGFDQNSYFMNPNFISDENLHIQAGFAISGAILPEVTHDFNGTERTNYTIGAYEETCTPIQITQEPQGDTLVETNQLQLNVECTGTLPYNYSWYKNDVPIAESNDSIFKNDTLEMQDNGTYYCIANNSCGTDTSASINIVVESFFNDSLMFFPSQKGAIALADYDNDNDLDLYITGATNANEPYQLNANLYQNVDGSFIETSLINQSIINGTAQWGDFDMDNDMDLLIAGTDDAENCICKIIQNNNNTFVEYNTGIVNVCNAIAKWADLDNDNDLDIIINGENNGETILKIYENNNAIFTEVNTNIEGIQNGDISIKDIDNNGTQDIFICGNTQTSYVSKLYLNNGNFIFNEIAYEFPIYKNSKSKIADIDKNGWNDILLMGEDTITSTPIFKLFLNNNTVFTEQNTNVIPLKNSTINLIDFNMNGYFDLIVTGTNESDSSKMNFYDNMAGIFMQNNTTLPYISNTTIATGDIDNDGDGDIIYAGKTNDNSLLSGIVENRIIDTMPFAPNTKPLAPNGISFFANNNSVNFSWQRGTDAETPHIGLSYNLLVKNTSTNKIVFSTLSNTNTGNTYAYNTGNVGNNLSWQLNNLLEGNYTVAIQTIDQSFMCSEFTEPVNFSITLDDENSDVNTYFKVFGGEQYDIFQDMSILPSGDIICIGRTKSYSSDTTNDILVVRMTQYADTVWTRAIGFDLPVLAERCIISAEGRIYITGNVDGGTYDDLITIAMDTLGNVLWNKIINGSATERGRNITTTSDNNIVVLGGTSSYGNTAEVGGTGMDYGISKYTSDGELLWGKTYGGLGNDFPRDVIETTDGGFLIIGTGNFDNKGGVFIVKTDIDGDTIWTKNYYYHETVYGRLAVKTFDGNYLIASYFNDCFLFKINNNGDVLWSKRYDSGQSEALNTLLQLSDGGFIFGGKTESAENGVDNMLLAKTDNQGNLLWSKSYGGTLEDVIMKVSEINSNSLLISGKTSSFQNGIEDAFILKTDNYGNSGSCYEYDLQMTQYDMSITILPTDATLDIFEQVIDTALYVHHAPLNTQELSIQKTVTTFPETINSNDGFINLEVTGGYPPYSFNWSNGATSKDIDSLSAGVYYVTISDTAGCDIIDSVIIEQNTNCTYANYTFTGNSNDESTYSNNAIVEGAELTANRFGNDSSAFYFDGSNDYMFLPLQINPQNITISGWFNTADSSIYQPYLQTNGAGGLSINNGQHTTLLEIGAGDFSNMSQFFVNNNTWYFVAFTYNGAEAKYYLNGVLVNTTSDTDLIDYDETPGFWLGTNSSQSDFFNGIIDDVSISLCVLDSSQIDSLYHIDGWDNCSASDLQVTLPNDTIIYTGDTINISANIVGGAAPYTYLWNTDSTSLAINIYEANTYIITVTDSNNCVAIDSIIIEEQAPPLSVIIETENAGCGIDNGEASVIISGGVPPYDILWSNGDSTETAYNLFAGMYNLMIIDSESNYFMQNITINTATGPEISIDSVFNNLCFNDSDGAIYLSLTSGTQPYNITWSTGDSLTYLENLAIGTYEIIVTDANQCLTTNSINITQPEQIVTDISSEQATCLSSDGSLGVIVSGGISPYTYSWSTGATSSVLENLYVGTYQLTVTDANNCSIMNLSGVVVENVNAPIIVLDSLIMPTCAGGDGMLDIGVSGGTMPYQSYLWSNDSTTEDLNNISSGIFNLSVTDANGCIGIFSTEIEEQLPLYQPICMVTVDTLHAKNLLYWGKTQSTGINYYNIYREGWVAGQYNQIAQVHGDSLSEYVDIQADPTLRSWRYKISAEDPCGNESELSEMHKTIHLTINQGIGNVINLIWDNYEGFPYSTFLIYRKTNISGWEVIDTLPATSWTYTDNNIPGDIGALNLWYAVVVLKEEPCYTSGVLRATGGPYSQSTSNLEDDPIISVGIKETKNSTINVYPNPNNGEFIIDFGEANQCIIEAYDISGNLVLTKNINDEKANINIKHFAKGVYIFKVIENKSTSNFRIIVQ